MHCDAVSQGFQVPDKETTMVTDISLIKVATIKASHAKQIRVLGFISLDPFAKDVYRRLIADTDHTDSDPAYCEALGWACNTFSKDMPEGYKAVLVRVNKQDLYWACYTPDTVKNIIANRKLQQLFL